ncbi:MAG TPA: acyl-CoA dehydratase activase-related protein [Desulfobacteria bacterium]|nr:acyl-CoA dehydratase activase-related protein [Desulfobacteria bacterium]
MSIRVGIPRGLSYYNYFPLWEKFFHSLKVELVLSPPTSSPIFNRGIVLATDETCLPVKVFFGHVESLKGKQLDYLFLPRMVSMEKQTYLCPKLLGFPEVVTALVPDLPPILTADFNLRHNPKELDKSFMSLGKQLGFGSKETKEAARRARLAQQRFVSLLYSGQEFEAAIKGLRVQKRPEEGQLTMGLLGHAYILYDEFTNLGLRKKLNRLGVRLLTPEGQQPEKCQVYLDAMPKQMFWSHSKKILGAGLSFIADPQIDGIINVSCFGCGPDSMVEDMIERACRRSGKPFLSLSMDEHTGEAGMITRLEAFIDMLRRRVEIESNLSAHG